LLIPASIENKNKVGIRLRNNKPGRWSCSSTNTLNIVEISFCGAISSYISKKLPTECTISSRKGCKSRRKSSDSLENPFTQQKIPDFKVFGFKVPALFIVFKEFGFVMNPVIFGTGFAPLCVNAKTNLALV